MSNNHKIIQPKYLGPPSFTQNIKNCNRKSALKGTLPNPIQQYPSSNDSVFAMGRYQYKRRAIKGGQNTNEQKIAGGYDQELYIENKKSIAIGKQAYKVGLKNFNYLSYTNFNRNDVNTALWKARSGGCIAPAKKGADANPYKSGGSSLIVRSGNATTRIGSTLSPNLDVEGSAGFISEIKRLGYYHGGHELFLR